MCSPIVSGPRLTRSPWQWYGSKLVPVRRTWGQPNPKSSKRRGTAWIATARCATEQGDLSGNCQTDDRSWRVPLGTRRSECIMHGGRQIPSACPCPHLIQRKETALALKLYAHPFSSYCQKVLIALYENSIPFEFRMLSLNEDAAMAELSALWPLKRIPVLVDEGRTVVESSIIIEHLGLHHPGPVRLIPEQADLALRVR